MTPTTCKFCGDQAERGSICKRCYDRRRKARTAQDVVRHAAMMSGESFDKRWVRFCELFARYNGRPWTPGEDG